MNSPHPARDGPPFAGPVPDLKPFALDDAKLHELNQDTSRLRIVTLFDRPGALEVDAALCRLYPLDEPGGCKLRCMMIPWQANLWWVMSVPFQDRAKVEAVIGPMGWKLNDGVPHVVDLDGQKMIFPERPERIRKFAVTVLATFPINSRRTFFLEKVRANRDDLGEVMLQWGGSQEEAERQSLELGALIERHLARERARGN